MQAERIVIAGMGAVTALGHTLPESWQAVRDGKCGIAPIDPPELGDIPNRAAGQVKNFRIEDHYPEDLLPAIHRVHAFSAVAAREALIQAGLLVDAGQYRRLREDVRPEEIGIVIGTGIGGSSIISDVGKLTREGDADLVDTYAIQQALPECVSTNLTMEMGITGEAETVCAACATGNRSIAFGFTMLTNERCHPDLNAMLVGGAEAALTPDGLSMFASPGMLSKRNKTPLEACQPFNQGANGFVDAEGGTVFLLAKESWALRLKLPIFAEVVGFGNTSDAKDKFFPSGEGGLRAMQRACRMAGITPDQIDYINAHAPGTPGDAVELDSILKLLGPDYRNVSISSTKGATGHMLAASSAFEAAVCIMTILTGDIPPTLNLTRPVREGLNLTPLKAQHRKVEYAMNNAFGLNGINSVVIFRAYHPLEQAA